MTNMCDRIRSSYVNKTGMEPDDKIISAVCEVVGREIADLQRRVKTVEEDLKKIQAVSKKFQAWASVNTPLGS